MKYYDKYGNPVKVHRFWGKFFAVFLGFLFGIIFTIGSVAGIVYYGIGKLTIKQDFALVKQFTGTDINYTEYIGEDYAEKTLLALTQDVIGMVEGLGNGETTLNDFNNVSPLVEPQIKNLLDSLYNTVGVSLPLHTEGERLGLMDTPITRMSEFLQSSIEPIELGAVLSSSSIGILRPGTANFDFYMLLCYGDKSNYEAEEDGTIKRDENGNALMKNGAKPTTIGDFLTGGEDGGIASLLDKLTLYGILDSMGSLDLSNAVTCALVLGTENRDYRFQESGEIEWLPLVYEYDGENDVFTDPKGKEFTRDGERYKNHNGDYILAATARAEIAYRVYKQDGTLLHGLTGENNRYTAQNENGETLYHSAPSVKTFMDTLGGEQGVVDLLSAIAIGDLLQVEQTDYDSNTLMYTLAYGERGIDFEIEDGKVVMLNGKKPNTLDSLISSSNDLIQNLSLGSLLGLNAESSSLMLSLAYGTEGVDYDIVEDKIVMREGHSPKTIGDLTDGDAFTETVEGLKIGDIVGTAEDGILHALQDKTIGDLKNPETIDNLTIGELVGTAEDGILHALQNKTIGDLKTGDGLDDLTIGDIVGTTEEGVLHALQDKTIADLKQSDGLDDIKLGDLIGNPETGVLAALKDKTIADLKAGDGLDDLKIGDIISDIPDDARLLNALKDYSIADFKDQSTIDGLKLTAIFSQEQLDSNTVLKALPEDTTLGNLSEKIEELTINKLLEDDIYDENTHEVKGTWKYLLTDSNGEVGEYTIRDMGTLVTNMTHNIQTASLYDLKADGILETDDSFLNTEVKYELSYTPAIGPKVTFAEIDEIYDENGNPKTKLGQMTVTEMMTYVTNVLNELN